MVRAPRYLLVREFLEVAGMSRSFVYTQIAEGAFLKQIHLVPSAIVWNEREVVHWMEDRIASR